MSASDGVLIDYVIQERNECDWMTSIYCFLKKMDNENVKNENVKKEHQNVHHLQSDSFSSFGLFRTYGSTLSSPYE